MGYFIKRGHANGLKYELVCGFLTTNKAIVCVYSSSLSKTAVHQLSLLLYLSWDRHLYRPLNIPFLGYYIIYRIRSQMLSPAENQPNVLCWCKKLASASIFVRIFPNKW